MDLAVKFLILPDSREVDLLAPPAFLCHFSALLNKTAPCRSVHSRAFATFLLPLRNVVVGQAVMVQHPNISVAQGKVVESHPPTTSVPHQIDQSNAPTQEVIAA